MSKIRMNKNDIEKDWPVCQSFHSGKWGFMRVNGCLDLSKCIYKTERSAKLARAKHVKELEAIEDSLKEQE